MAPVPTTKFPPPPLPRQEQPQGIDTQFSLDGLLPVIRSIRTIRSFRRRLKTGVAVFRGSLITFRIRNDNPLPDEVYADDDGAALMACKKVRRVCKIAFADVERIDASMDGLYCNFFIRTKREHHFFSLLRQESRHVVAALQTLLPGRFFFTPDPDGWTKPSNRRPGVIVVCVILAAAATAYWLLGMIPPDQAGVSPGTAPRQYLLWGGLLVVAYLFNNWLIRPRAGQRAGKIPLHSKTLGWLFRIVGFLLLVVSYLFPTNIAVWLFDYDLLSGSTAYVLVAQAISALLLGTGVLLLYFGYRLGRVPGIEVLAEDIRAPVLYLRSFGDDGRHSLTPRVTGAVWLGTRPIVEFEGLGPLANVHPARLLRLALGWVTDTSEEQLGVYLRRIGPFVAIGQPGEALITGGAARLYVGHDQWQAEVLRLLKMSMLVVLQPAETEGVWHEIRFCRQLADPRRVLMSLANFQDSEQRYEEFRLRFEQFIGHALPRNARSVPFLRFSPDWQPIPVHSVFYSPFVWPLKGLAVNLARTLQPFLGELTSRTLPAPPRRFGPPRLISTVAALVVWTLYPAATLFVAAAATHMATEYQLLGQINHRPMQTFRGDDVPYTWRLGKGWTRQNGHPAAATTAYAEAHNAVRAVVVCVPDPPAFGNPQQGLEAVLAGMRQGNRAVETEDRRTVQSSGRQWLQTTLSGHDSNGRFLEIARSYDGPDAQCILQVNMGIGEPGLERRAQGTLTDILDQFELPPLTPEQRALATATLEDAVANPRVVADRFDPTGIVTHLGQGWKVQSVNDNVRFYRFLGHDEIALMVFRDVAQSSAAAMKKNLEGILTAASKMPDVTLTSRESGAGPWLDFSAQTSREGISTRWEYRVLSRPDGLFGALTSQRDVDGYDSSAVAHLLELARQNIEPPPEVAVQTWIAPDNAYHLKLSTAWQPGDQAAQHTQGYDRVMVMGRAAKLTVALEKPQPTFQTLDAFTPEFVARLQRREGASDITVDALGTADVSGTKWAWYRTAYRSGSNRLVSWMAFTQTTNALYTVEAYCAESDAERLRRDMLLALAGVIIDKR